MTTVRFPDTDIAAIARLRLHRGHRAVGRRLGRVREWLAGPRAAPLVIDAKIADDGGSWLSDAFRHQAVYRAGRGTRNLDLIGSGT